MNGLSPDARALVERARHLHEPSAGDRSAVRQALALKLPVLLGSAVIAQSSAAAASAAAASAAAGVRIALVGKWLVGGVLLGSVSVGALELQTPARTDAPSGRAAEQRRTPHPRPSLMASEHRAAVPALASAPAPRRAAEAFAVEGPPNAGARSASSVSRPGATADATRGPIRSEEASTDGSQRLTVPNAPTSPDGVAAHAGEAGATALGAGASRGGLPGSTHADQLLLEARALRHAQAALREGEAARALELVEQQASAFGAGALNEERKAVRLVALCALGRASWAEIDRFLETSGSSPLAARVRSACAQR